MENPQVPIDYANIIQDHQYRLRDHQYRLRYHPDWVQWWESVYVEGNSKNQPKGHELTENAINSPKVILTNRK